MTFFGKNSVLISLPALSEEAADDTGHGAARYSQPEPATSPETREQRLVLGTRAALTFFCPLHSPVVFNLQKMPIVERESGHWG